MPDNPALSPKLQIKGRFIAKNISKVKTAKKTEESRRKAYYINLAITIVIITFGLFVVIA